MAVLASKPAGPEASTARINTVSFPNDIIDINKDAESDIFSFFIDQANGHSLNRYVNNLNELKHIPLGYTRTLINKTLLVETCLEPFALKILLKDKIC